MTRVMRGASLSGYVQVAADLGLDPKTLLRRLGIDSRILTEGDFRYAAEKLLELLETSARETGCETFGLRMAATRRLADYGPISLLLAHQPTMRDAMMTRMRFQRMLNEALLLNIEDRPDDTVVLREELLSGRLQDLRQAYELAVGTLFQIFRGPVGPSLRPLSVHFTHGPPANLAYHRQFFGPIVVFDSDFNGVICNRADFDRPNPAADPALARYAEGFIKTLPFAETTSLKIEVERAIHVLLPFNGASISAVARRLGLSERTLQRRLADEGSDFSRILNEIRREHAVRYLANARVSVAEIAGLVGYNHETSFTRWFAGEFGITPSGWRAGPRPGSVVVPFPPQ